MKSYEAAIRNPAHFRGTFGITVDVFLALLPQFNLYVSDWFAGHKLDGNPRLNKMPNKSNSPLKTVEEKLMFVLYFNKNNPTHDALAFTFEIGDSDATKWINILLPLYEKACRALEQEAKGLVKEKIAQMAENQQFAVDASNRSVQRPCDPDEQKKLYNGRDKDHCVKNLIVATLLGIIVFVGPTSDGKIHDFRLAQAVNLAQYGVLYADSGFQGLQKQYKNIVLPFKKRKGKDRTDQQLEFNKKHSSVRVRIEHVFARLKSFHVLRYQLRAKLKSTFDLVFRAACSIHNAAIYLRYANLQN